MSHLQMDPHQLTEIPEAVKAKQKKSWSVSDFLTFAQFLALLAAGVWTLLNYFSFAREQQLVALDQQRLALQQQQALAGLERERTIIAAEHEKLALQQQKILADSEVRQAELTVKAIQLDNVIKGFSIQEATEGRITGEAKITLGPAYDDGLVPASFSLAVRNTSKTKVEISWVLVHWFLGTVNEKVQGRSVTRVNSPPVVFTGRSERGPIDWKEIGYRGFVYPGSRVRRALRELPQTFEFEDGGGGTKILQSGDSSGFEDSFLVSGEKSDWIGFVASVGVDSGLSGDRLFHYVRWMSVSDAPPSQGKSTPQDNNSVSSTSPVLPGTRP